MNKIAIKKSFLSKIKILSSEIIKITDYFENGQGNLNVAVTMQSSGVSSSGEPYYQATLPQNEPTSYDDGILTI